MTIWLASLPDLLPKITSPGTVGSPYQELWPPEPLQGGGCKGRGIECTKRSESELLPVNENSSWSKPKCDLKGNICYQTTPLDLASSSLFEGVLLPFVRCHTHPMRRSCFLLFLMRSEVGAWKVPEPPIGWRAFITDIMVSWYSGLKWIQGLKVNRRQQLKFIILQTFLTDEKVDTFWELT